MSSVAIASRPASLFLPTKSDLLLASADENLRERLLRKIPEYAWSVQQARGGAEALARLERGRFTLVVLDSMLPDLDCEEVAQAALGMSSADLWIVESGTDEIRPQKQNRSESGRLLGILRRREEASEVGTSSYFAAEQQPAPQVEPLPGMLGDSAAMRRVYQVVRMVAPRNTAILLSGASGTGKEVVARAVHTVSPRAKSPFVVLNCAAIPETLLESELFGYTRGAFTGAVQSRLGRIQSASHGTLFLDEIGELPLSMQAKLLRFLQDGELQRLGSAETFRADVRVIAATNQDLPQRVAEGLFRNDLFFRLSVFPVQLPPLCERGNDIELLARHFLEGHCAEAEAPLKEISRPALAALCQHPWPGNVRELQHTMERAFILSGEQRRIEMHHLLFAPTAGVRKPPASVKGF